MKKNLITVLALAATGASFAQVTVYGIADVGYSNAKTSSTASGVTTDTRNDGFLGSQLSTGRIGFKGEEDLGGGMKAEFRLEGAVNTADGTTAASPTFFGRESTVGLSGGFGSMRLGLSQNNVHRTYLMADPYGQNGTTVLRLAPLPTRTKNAIWYDSNDFSGFSFGLSYANTDSGTNTAPSVTKDTGWSVKYASGPLLAAYAAGTNDITGTNGNTAAKKGEAASVTYDLGVVKLWAGYTKGRTQTVVGNDSYVDNTETNFSISAPIGALTVIGQVGRNTQSTVTNSVEQSASTGSGNDWTLGVQYSLSKRTTLYGRTGVIDNFVFGASANGTDNRSSLTASSIGLRHTF